MAAKTTDRHQGDFAVRLQNRFAGEPRIATISAYRMPGVPAASQMMQLDLAGIAVSAGSACSSGSLKTSHVLTAMGIDPDLAHASLRLTVGATHVTRVTA